MKKALIRKTGETFDVKYEFSMKRGKVVVVPSGQCSSEMEDYYVLSNGETYRYNNLIVGIDEIREWKLKNNLDI